ncbi:MAG: metallophosphoesterase [Bacillota bacterium]|nr:metallophosphoesterase [Bacillota bacterium]
MKFIYLIRTIFLLVLFIGIFGLLNYYVGKRSYTAITKFIPVVGTKLYWTIFWIAALSYIISSIGRNFLPHYIRSPFTVIGVYWMSAFFYLLLLLPIADILRFIFHKTALGKTSIGNFLSFIYGNGLIVVILVIGLIFYGMYNASHTVVTDYSLNIDKKAGKIKTLNIAMVSDIHLGSGINNKKLSDMVDSINKLNPDIIFLCGDIIDENTSTSEKKYMTSAFKNLKSKYGVYAIAGNHENYSNDLNDLANNYKESNVKLLLDETVIVDNSFVVIGRMDASFSRGEGNNRKDIKQLLSKLDPSLPIINLDHQPVSLDEAEKNGIDLQLSGHTHKGQIFPLNLITKKIYVDDYGYYKKDNYQLIVSSGYGTWGPPIRIDTKGEIVNIKVKFQ